MPTRVAGFDPSPTGLFCLSRDKLVGSWVKDSSMPQTYMELDKGKIALRVLGGAEITERVRCP